MWWDASGGDDFEAFVPLLARGARIIAMAGMQATPRLPVGQLYTRDASVLGFAISNASAADLAEAAKAINQMLAAGRLKGESVRRSTSPRRLPPTTPSKPVTCADGSSSCRDDGPRGPQPVHGFDGIVRMRRVHRDRDGSEDHSQAQTPAMRCGPAPGMLTGTEAAIGDSSVAQFGDFEDMEVDRAAETKAMS